MLNSSAVRADAARRIERDWGASLPTIMRRFTARLVSASGAPPRWRCTWEMSCIEGAFCEEPSHEGDSGDVEVSDEELASRGLGLDADLNLQRLDYDTLLVRAPLVAAAHAIAERAHAGGRRKHGPPYIVHPLAVGRRLWERCRNPTVELVAAALVHDVLEDSKVTAADLALALGEEVARLAIEVTKREGESKPAYLARLPGITPEALALKFADRTDNLCDLVRQSDMAFAKGYVRETETYFVPLLPKVKGELAADLTHALDAARAFAQG